MSASTAHTFNQSTNKHMVLAAEPHHPPAATDAAAAGPSAAAATPSATSASRSSAGTRPQQQLPPSPHKEESVVRGHIQHQAAVDRNVQFGAYLARTLLMPRLLLALLELVHFRCAYIGWLA